MAVMSPIYDQVSFCVACGNEGVVRTGIEVDGDAGGLSSVSIWKSCSRCRSDGVYKLSPDGAIKRIRMAVYLSEVLRSAACEFEEGFRVGTDLIERSELGSEGDVSEWVKEDLRPAQEFMDEVRKDMEALLECGKIGGVERMRWRDRKVPTMWRRRVERLLCDKMLSGCVDKSGKEEEREDLLEGSTYVLNCNYDVSRCGGTLSKDEEMQ